MNLQQTYRDVLLYNAFINYQYFNDGNYVTKNYYYPIDNGLMKLFIKIINFNKVF